MVPSLPAETLDHIIDFTHDSPSTLANLALVCKSFVYSSRYHLFGKLVITYRSPDAPLLLQRRAELISSRQTFLPFVKHVEISTTVHRIGSEAVFDIVLHIVRLLAMKTIEEFSPTTLNIGIHSRDTGYSGHEMYMAFCQGFKTVTSLALFHIDPKSYMDVVALVSSFPALYEFSVDIVSASSYTLRSDELEELQAQLLVSSEFQDGATRSLTRNPKSIDSYESMLNLWLGADRFSLEEIKFVILAITSDPISWLSKSKEVFIAASTEGRHFSPYFLRSLLAQYSNLVEIRLDYPEAAQHIIDFIRISFPKRVQNLTLKTTQEWWDTVFDRSESWDELADALIARAETARLAFSVDIYSLTMGPVDDPIPPRVRKRLEGKMRVIVFRSTDIRARYSNFDS